MMNFQNEKNPCLYLYTYGSRTEYFMVTP